VIAVTAVDRCLDVFTVALSTAIEIARASQAIMVGMLSGDESDRLLAIDLTYFMSEEAVFISTW
jgi:hypothetical protein